MGEEKRRQTRHLVCVLAHLERTDAAKKRSALINDLSGAGAHLLTREKLEIGDKVSLTLLLDGERVLDVPAKVVRVTPRTMDQSSLWTHNVGVEFEQPVAELAEVGAKLAAKSS